jgi:hypothetical protein
VRGTSRLEESGRRRAVGTSQVETSVRRSESRRSRGT